MELVSAVRGTVFRLMLSIASDPMDAAPISTQTGAAKTDVSAQKTTI